MDDKILIPQEEYDNLNERIKKLATEKSYLQLFTHLMSEMSSVSGLDNTIQNLLQIILKNIGGSNLIIYYLIEEEIFYADVLGEVKKVDKIDDDIVNKVFETREPFDVQSDAKDTKLLSSESLKAHTWAFPLQVGSELIGVFKIENLYTSIVDIHFHLPTFFNFASHILKNEILGHSKLKAAYDKLSEENRLRKQVESELRLINEELENRVEERTVELNNVNLLLKEELSEHRKTEQQLKNQYLLLSALINSPDDIIIFSLDRQYCYTAFNEKHKQEMQKVWNVDIKAGMCLLDCMTLPHIRDLAKTSMDRALKGEAFTEIQYQPGADIYYELSWNPIYQKDDVIGLTCFVRDITERKNNEAQILKLNRIYAVLSNINEAIVRVHNKQELLDSVCRIAIEQGKFRMVWIGIVNDKTNKVDVVASNGVEGDYLEKINIDLSDELRCKGPSGTAIRTGKYIISNNIVNDPTMNPWREDAIKYGYKSSASFPLIVFDKTVGVFNIYSDESDFFHEDDIKLIYEIAKDISFALEYLENENIKLKVEKALLENKQRLDNIIANSPGAVYRCALDPDWTMEFISEGITRITGFPAKEFLNNSVRSYASIIYSDDREYVEQTITNSVKSNENYELDYRLVTTDGTLRWVHEKGRGVFGSDGCLLYLDGIIFDITERKMAEQELLNNQNLFIAGNTIVFKWVAAEGWPVEYVSPNILANFGYKPEDFISGKIPFASVVHPNDLQRVGEEVIAHSNSGVPHFEQEYQILHAKGNYRWVYDYTTVIRDNNGKITHYFGYIIDITERKRAEQALQSAAEEIRDLYNRAPCGYHSLDKDGVIVRMNNTELEWLGYTFDEIVGKKKFIDIITKESQELFYKNFPVFLEKGIITDLEFECVRKDGSVFPVVLSATAVKDSNGKFIMSRSTIFDITERKLLEKTLFFIAQQGWKTEKENFFDALVNFLGKTLDVDYVIIDKLDENSKVAETVALYARGAIMPNMSYALKGTPCENVMGKRLCYYPKNVQQLFPEDKLLAEMQVESYIGIPLWDSTGQPIGLIALMRGKPMEEDSSIIQILQLVATRVAAELEQQKSNYILRMREREFRTLAENLPHHIARYDIDGKVKYLNHQNAVSDYSESPIIGERPTEHKFKNPADVTKYQENLSKTLKTGEQIEMEIVLTDLNEIEHNYAVTFIAERDNNGMIIGAMAIGQDITERKRSELELSEQMNEINRFNKLMLGREEKMIELKKEINMLLEKEGKLPKYEIEN